MLHSATGSAHLNALLNHLLVRPWMGTLGVELDVSPAFANPDNVLLESDNFGFIALRRDVGLYDCLIPVVPGISGGDALALLQEALRHLFTRTDCTEAITTVAGVNEFGLALVEAAGFAETFSRERAWLLPSGERCASRHFAMSASDWIAHDPVLLDSGRVFRSQLERLALQPNREDPTADRLMGACAAIARSGNPRKALDLYNRVAVIFCGYPEMKLVASEPPTIDVAGAVFSIEEAGLELIAGGALDLAYGHA